MFNSQVPERTFTLYYREKIEYSLREGYFYQGVKVKEEHYDRLDDIVHIVTRGCSYNVVDPFYAVGYNFSTDTKRIVKEYRWNGPNVLIEVKELTSFVIVDNRGKNVLKEELREYASHMPAKRSWYTHRNWGWSRRKSGGFCRSYGSCSINNVRRNESSKDQDSLDDYDTSFKVRAKAQHFEPWYEGDCKGQRTNWKHHRKTQYKIKAR